MANKRKKPRKRPYTPPAPKGGAAAAADEAAAEKASAARASAAKPVPQRRQYKEEARKARERAIKRYRRRAALRRVATIVVVAVVVGAVFFFLTRVGIPKLSDEALAAAEAAGCSQLQQVPEQGRSHQPPFVYDEQPATSGPHAGDRTTPAGIYTEPQPEEEVVHSLEHGYAVIYYRAEDPGGISDDVLTALENAAEDEEEVILAPYANLPEGTAVAFAGWTHLLTCPGAIEADQAETVARGWIEEIRNHKAAPEANIG